MIAGSLPDGHGVARRVLQGVLVGVLAITSTGCVGTIYAVKSSNAASSLEQARTLGAERYAQFEYYYAKAHLDKAMEEAAQAEYGDAIDFADVAEEYAEKAIELSRAAHRGAGR